MSKTSQSSSIAVLAALTLLSVSLFGIPLQACQFYKSTIDKTRLWGLPEENTSSVLAVLPAGVRTCIENQLPTANGQTWGRVSFYIQDKIRFPARGWVNLARLKALPRPVAHAGKDAEHGALPSRNTDDGTMVKRLKSQQHATKDAAMMQMKHKDMHMMHEGEQKQPMMEKSAMTGVKNGKEKNADPLLLQRNWRLNGSKSSLQVETTSNHKLVETHRFTKLSGSIDKNGKATINVMLNALETGDKIRNVRIAHLFFQSEKFPRATITTQLDMNQFDTLARRGKQLVDLHVKLKLHGHEKQLNTKVRVNIMKNGQLAVASLHPLILSAGDFALSKGLSKLIEVAGGKDILPTLPIRFRFVFDAKG